MKKIISISFKNNFIKIFTEQLLFREGIKDYSKICVVFPGKRPFLYLRKYLADKVKTSFYPPRMLSVNEFINYLTEKKYPELSIINEIDGVWGLYKIISETQFCGLFKEYYKDFDFLNVYPWVKKIYSFINQIDIEDIKNNVLKNLQDNAEIGYNIPKQINDLFLNIVDLRKKFHQWLEKNQLFTRGYSYLKARKIISNENLSEFNEIYFTGLFALTATEKQIIKKLLKENKAHLIWHGSPDKWGILKDLQNYFKEEIEYFKEKSNFQKQNIKIYSAFDFHSESQQVYEVLKQEKEIKDTVVVTPFHDTLFPLLSFAVDRILTEKKVDKFNISLDYPLSKTSLFFLIKNLIHCHISSRQKGSSIYYYTEAYLHFFNNPFIKNIQIKKIYVRDIIRKIKNILMNSDSPLYNKTFIKLDEIENALDKTNRENIKELHSVFFKGLEAASDLKDVCKCIEDILDYILKFSEVKSYILSGEIFNLLFDNLMKMQFNKFSSEIFSTYENRKKLLEFFLKLMEQNSLRFGTVPLQDLEIVGMLETRNLNFKNVLILDMQEGVIPVGRKIDPLIPVSILKDIGMPSLEFHEEIYEYYFYRLIENAETLHLFYLETPEMDRSRYIERIIWEKEKESKKLNVEKINKVKYKIRLMLNSQKDGIVKDKHIMKKIINMEFSSSVIDNYLFCPIKFYYRNILNLTIPETISVDIDASDRGKVIHNILKELFNKFKGRFINKNNYYEIWDEFQSIFKEQFKNKVHTGEYYLFKKMAFIKLKQFIDKNIKNMKYEFKTLETEKNLGSVYSFDDYNIKIRGRIDRIDKVRDDTREEYMIIDYKTGNSPAKKMFTYKPCLIKEQNVEIIREYIKSFQLPLYIYLYRLNYDIPMELLNAKLIYLGDLKEELLLNIEKDLSKEDIFNYYNNLLQFIFCEIFNPEKPFVKYKDTDCQYCEYKPFCKF